MQRRMCLFGVVWFLCVMVIVCATEGSGQGQCDTRVVLGGTDNGDASDQAGSVDSTVSPGRYRFIAGEDSTVVPFAMKAYRLTIAANVNGKGPFRFLLGTGKSGSVVSKKVIDKLKLEPYGSSVVRGSAGNAATRMVKIDSLQIENLVWYPGEFEVVDNSDTSKCVFNGFDGVLGYEFFKSFPVRVSFEWKRVVVFNPTNVALPSPGIPVKIDLTRQMAVKGMTLDNRAIQVAIDLSVAARFAVFKDWIWAKEYPLEGGSYDPNYYDCAGIEGYWIDYVKYTNSTLKIDDIVITDSWSDLEKRLTGGRSLESASWMTMGHRLVEAQKRSPVNAIAGVGILERFNLLIDFPNGRIYFDKRQGTK